MKTSIKALMGTLIVFSLFLSCEKDRDFALPENDDTGMSAYAYQAGQLLAQLPVEEMELLTEEDIAEFKEGPIPSTDISSRSAVGFDRGWHPILAVFYCKTAGGVVQGTGPWYGRRNADIRIVQDLNMATGFEEGNGVISDSEGSLDIAFTAGTASFVSNNRMRQNLKASAASGTGVFCQPAGTFNLTVSLRDGHPYPVVILARGWIYFGDGGCTTPQLVSPESGAVLDNGCTDGADGHVWEFDWEDFPEATQYQLYVRHEGAPLKYRDTIVAISEFRDECSACYVADQNAKDWFWKVRAMVNGAWTEWSEMRYFDVEPVNTDCGPHLLTPEPGAVLDNGCYNQTDAIEWEFDWEDFPGATQYHLFVMGAKAIIPVEDTLVAVSEFKHFCTPCYVTDSNAKDWFWRVSAEVDGAWTVWSETRYFDVEPLDTDCL